MRQSARVLVLACLLLVPTHPSRLRAQEPGPERLDVAGLVADATTGAPLEGAAVSIEGTALRALTNADGRFVLRGISPGEQTWVIQRLGYATWRQPLAVAHLDQLKIGLLARPVALEAIEVTVSRLEARRRTAGVSVHTAAGEMLHSSPATDAADLVTSRMHWAPALCPSAGNDTVDAASLQGMNAAICIRSRGKVVQPTVYLDERPIPAALLFAYGADEIHSIDYIGGGPAAQIRVYTVYFLESGKPLRPLGF